MPTRNRFVYDFLIRVERALCRTAVGRRLKTVRAAAYLYRGLYKAFRPSGTIVATIQSGDRMHLDPADLLVTRRLLTDGGIWEPDVTEALRLVLKKGMTFVDIGANVGYFTVLAARSVGSEGKVYAFEPEARNYALLCKNVEENGYTNVQTIRKAVSDRTGIARLYLSSQHWAGHTLSAHSLNADFVEVETTCLDEFFKGHTEKIDVIKVDVEGAEDLVFDGMTALLTRCPHLVLITEFCPQLLRRMGSNPQKYLEKLQSHGFKILPFWPGEGPMRALDMASLPSVIESLLQADETRNLLNLLCLREH
jgi:FkbM family methyltransferase